MCFIRLRWLPVCSQLCVCPRTCAHVWQRLPWGQHATAERQTWTTMQTNAWCHDYRHYVGIIPKVPTSDNVPINSTTKHWAQRGNYSTSPRHLGGPAGHACHLLAQKTWQKQTKEPVALGHLFVYTKTKSSPETDEPGGLTCQHPPGPSPPTPALLGLQWDPCVIAGQPTRAPRFPCSQPCRGWGFKWQRYIYISAARGPQRLC